MSANIPYIVTGTGNGTVTPPSPKRMMLVSNTDAAATLGVVWNGGGPGTWTLQPGDKKGNYVRGGVTQIALTSTGTWAVELAD